MKSTIHPSIGAKILLAWTLVVVLTSFTTSSAQAHANLVRSDPSDGVNLSASPEEIQLWFDEPVSAEFSSVRLFDANSQPLEIAGIRNDPDDPTKLILSLSELPDGLYSVIYRVFSETDGHFSQGTLVFGIGEGADPSSSTNSLVDFSAPPLPEVVLRWMSFTLLAILVGTVAILLFVFTPAISSAESRKTSVTLQAARLRILGFAGYWSGFSMLVWMGFLFWQAIELLDTLPAGIYIWDVTWRILAQSRWGAMWLIRQSALLILCISFVISSRKLRMSAIGSLDVSPQSSNLPVIALLSLGLLVVQALSSHASGLSTDTALALVVDTIHLLAASCWVGGLLALAIGLFPELRKQGGNSAALVKAGWKPFSKVAAASVGILFVTGLYSSGRQVASLDALITTLYGQALLLKVALFLVVGLFGLLNSLLLHPELLAPVARWFSRPAGWSPLPMQKLPTLIMAEGCVGLLVMVLVSVVTASPAPRGAEYTVSPEQIPGALSQQVDDLVVTLVAKPNLPGQNVFTVFTSSTRKPAPAQIARVIVRFEAQEQETGRASVIAEQVEPGRYLLSGAYFSFAGPWQVEVVIRRLGVEDSVARFNWIVAPPGEVRPSVVSKYAWEAPLTFAAAGMLLVVLLVTYLSWFRGSKLAPKRHQREAKQVY